MQEFSRQPRVRHPRRRQHIHPPRPRRHQRRRTRIGRRPARHHIVSQQHTKPRHIPPHRDRPHQHLPPRRRRQGPQRHRLPHPRQRILQHRLARHPSQLPRQQRRLVIPPLPQPPHMQRHGHHHLRTFQQFRPRPRHQPRQPPRQIGPVRIFKRQNQPLCHLIIPQRRPRL